MNAKSKRARLLSSVVAAALSIGVFFSVVVGASADVIAEPMTSNAASPTAPAQVSTLNNVVSSAVNVTPKAGASNTKVYAANDVNPDLDNPWPCPDHTTNVNKSIFGRADITICTWTQGIHGKGEEFYLRVMDNTYDPSNPHHVPDNLDKYYISGLPIYQNTDPNNDQVPYTSGSNLGWKYDDSINTKSIGRAKDGTVLQEVSGADLRGGRVGIIPPADWTGQIPIKVWRADFSQNLFTDFDYGTFNYIGQIPDANTKSLVCDSNNHQNCSRTGTTVGQTMQQNYVYHDPRTATDDTEPKGGEGNNPYTPGEGTGQWAPHDGQYSIWPTSLMTGPYGRWGKGPSDPTVNPGDPNTWGVNWNFRGFTWNNQWADLRSDSPYVSYGPDQQDKGDFLIKFPSKRLLGYDDSQKGGNVCVPFNNDGCAWKLSVLTNNPARTPLGVYSGNVGQFDIPKSCISMSTSLIPSKQCPDSNSAWGDMGNDDTIKRAGKVLVVNGRNRANGTDTIINSTIKPPSSDDEMFVFRAQLANVLYVGTPKPVQLAVYTGSPSDSNNDKLMFTNYLAGDSQSDYDNAHTHWTDVSTALTPGSSQPFNIKIRNWSQSGYGNDFALDNIVVSPIKSSPGVLRAVRWTSDKSSDPVTTTVVKRGQTITYKLTVTNNSESDRAKIAAPAQPTNQCNDSNNPGCIDVHTMPLRGSVLVDDVSDVMKDGKATWLGNFQPGSQASYDSGKKQIVWKVPDVPANGSVTLTYQVQMAKDPSGPLTIKNTVKALPYGDKDNVWVSGSDMESRNNSSSNWWERADSSDAVPDPEKCSKSQPCSTTHYLSDAWWNKVSSRNKNNFLRGSEWKITGPDLIDANGNHADYIIVKDNVDPDKDGSQKGWAGPDKDTRNGYLKIIGMLGAPEAGKPDAKYKLVETRAPAGYQLNTTEYTITIPAGKQSDVPPDGTGGVIPNDQTTGPNLPFTGGISADYIILGGIVLTLIAALPAAITAAKRRRS